MPFPTSAIQSSPGLSRLEGPPPPPTGVPSRTGLLGLNRGTPESSGVPGGPSPQQMALMSMMGIEQSARQLLSVLPGLTPSVAGFLETLRTTVPQALAEYTQAAASVPTASNAGVGSLLSPQTGGGGMQMM